MQRQVNSFNSEGTKLYFAVSFEKGQKSVPQLAISSAPLQCVDHEESEAPPFAFKFAICDICDFAQIRNRRPLLDTHQTHRIYIWLIDQLGVSGQIDSSYVSIRLSSYYPDFGKIVRSVSLCFEYRNWSFIFMFYFLVNRTASYRFEHFREINAVFSSKAVTPSLITFSHESFFRTQNDL